MLVLDPIGMVHVERQAVETTLEQRRGVGAAFDVADDVLEAHETARRGRGVVDIDPHDVRQIVRGLRIEELGVLRAELFEHLRFLLPYRHCEEPKATRQSRVAYTALDCFASLAMTKEGKSRPRSRARHDRKRTRLNS